MSEKEPKFEKIKKPVGERISYEIDGENRRLSWVAENRPEILIRELSEVGTNRSAILSALHRVGYDGQRMFNEAKEHPEWGVRLLGLESIFPGVSSGGRERQDVP